jgi:hypothetical protein
VRVSVPGYWVFLLLGFCGPSSVPCGNASLVRVISFLLDLLVDFWATLGSSLLFPTYIGRCSVRAPIVRIASARERHSLTEWL